MSGRSGVCVALQRRTEGIFWELLGDSADAIALRIVNDPAFAARIGGLIVGAHKEKLREEKARDVWDVGQESE